MSDPNPEDVGGVAIIGQLLQTAATGEAPVAPANIKGGRLPERIALPNLLLTTVSVLDRLTLSQGAKRFVRERVQVTVRAASYAERKSIMRWVKSTCHGQRGDFGQLTQASVLSAGGGPDFNDETASIYMGSHDFSVSFNEPA